MFLSDGNGIIHVHDFCSIYIHQEKQGAESLFLLCQTDYIKKKIMKNAQLVILDHCFSICFVLLQVLYFNDFSF